MFSDCGIVNIMARYTTESESCENLSFPFESGNRLQGINHVKQRENQRNYRSQELIAQVILFSDPWQLQRHCKK